MNTKQIYLSGAFLACCLVTPGQASQYAQPAVAAKASQTTVAPQKAVKLASAAKTTKVSKTGSKAAKIAKASKTAKTAAKATPVVVASAAAQPANPYLSGQPVNPYLANQPANPFFASQASNPYLAYRYEKPSPVVQTVAAPNAVRPAVATRVAQRPTISKISFEPMPVNIYLLPNQKPTMAISTPCSAMEKMTGNSPIFKAMEQMAFGMIGNMNEAGFMPMLIEPVCT